MGSSSKRALAALSLGGAALCGAAPAAEVRPGVEFAGKLAADGTTAAMAQALIFDFATSWAACDAQAMRRALAEDVAFSYPTTAHLGRDAALADLALFCEQAADTSFWFPADAFTIDAEAGRAAVEVQFRTFQRGARQAVNDVWVVHFADGRITVLKEYLDGRVKDLQALGVLELDESPETLTPWPPRTAAWEACFPVVKAAPINDCPPKE
ncbi:Ketosteroid isomerase-related protein [Rubrimonas cliftonensis]|uniref:Ketosteroid isomerase-related protein n=2 Tax=Rubrimonas cliftonensis TaxID=89524 RepID=A0A1H3YVS0_9RHOB|nr:Ketosteroid isomerase-related protein [Rubrimonas cliftonensis]